MTMIAVVTKAAEAARHMDERCRIIPGSAWTDASEQAKPEEHGDAGEKCDSTGPSQDGGTGRTPDAGAKCAHKHAHCSSHDSADNVVPTHAALKSNADKDDENSNGDPDDPRREIVIGVVWFVNVIVSV
jgi:hypothetical protein